MLGMVKEIGIFVIIAQAILYFVPGEHYAKYVKVLVGLMIIAKIAIPVLNLFSGKEWEEIVFSGELLEEEMIQNKMMLEQQDAYGELLKRYSDMAEQQSMQEQKEK